MQESEDLAAIEAEGTFPGTTYRRIDAWAKGGVRRRDLVDAVLLTAVQGRLPIGCLRSDQFVVVLAAIDLQLLAFVKSAFSEGRTPGWGMAVEVASPAWPWLARSVSCARATDSVFDQWPDDLMHDCEAGGCGDYCLDGHWGPCPDDDPDCPRYLDCTGCEDCEGSEDAAQW